MENKAIHSPINEGALLALMHQLPRRERELIVRQAYGMATMAKLLEGERKPDGDSDKSA